MRNVCEGKKGKKWVRLFFTHQFGCKLATKYEEEKQCNCTQCTQNNNNDGQWITWSHSAAQIFVNSIENWCHFVTLNYFGFFSAGLSHNHQCILQLWFRWPKSFRLISSKWKILGLIFCLFLPKRIFLSIFFSNVNYVRMKIRTNDTQQNDEAIVEVNYQLMARMAIMLCHSFSYRSTG